MISAAIKIFIIDDHEMIISGVKSAVESIGRYSVVGSATEGYAGLEGIIKTGAHIAIVDLSIPGLNGFEILQHLRDKKSTARVIFLTSFTENSYIKRALSMGVDGYVLKEDSSSELITALENVVKGFKYMTPRVMTKIATDFELSGVKVDAPAMTEKLSGRELDVLRLIGLGKKGLEICSELNISEPTLKTHKRNLMKKLNLDSTPELMLYVVKNRLFQ